MKIEEIIKKLSNDSNFEVKKPCGYPKLKPNHIMPDDMKKFYSICGGIKCYLNCDAFPIEIMPPLLVKHANTIIIGEKYAEEYKDDLSYSWYLILDAKDGNYISIDCGLSKLGRCYESTFINHGVIGETPIIALSLTELLYNIFEYKGDFFYWKESEFNNYGDAYDK